MDSAMQVEDLGNRRHDLARRRRNHVSAPPPRRPVRFFPSRIAAVAFGSIALISGFYVFSLVKSISILSNKSLDVDIDPDAPTAPIYDHTAPYFDRNVSSVEFWLGISALRRQMIERAAGDVLEVGVGTGRNHGYYKLGNCRSITMIDPSENMILMASMKWNKQRLLPEWRETAPDGMRRVNFKLTSAADDVLPPMLAGESDRRGFTTIVSAFTLCSMPRPAETLAHLCSLLSRPSDASEAPRVLLLEHGQSSYDWLNKLLDNSAPAHALEHGCWWNRDIGAIAEEAAKQADMDIVSLRRKHFGTTWIVEMKPKPGAVRPPPMTTDAQPSSSVEHDSGEGQVKAGLKNWWQVWR